MASFSLEVEEFVRKTGIKFELVLRKLALDGFTYVVMGSPVDTGRFRHSWRVALNNVDLSVDPEGEYGSPLEGFGLYDALHTLADLPSNLKRGINVAIIISNNISYAESLENGHSTQAPSGVLHISFERLKVSLQEAIASTGQI